MVRWVARKLNGMIQTREERILKYSIPNLISADDKND